MRHRWQKSERRVRGLLPGVLLACVLATLATQAGCSGDDSNGTPPVTSDAGASDSGAGGVFVEASVSDALGNEAVVEGGSPGAVFSATAIDFGAAGCGGASTTQTLSITAGSAAPLVVSATTSGAAFSVTPTSLSLPAGGTAALTVSAAVPGSASAGTAITGALNLFTNDPTNTSVSIPLSVLPTGATLAFAPGGPAAVSFPTTEVGTAATPVPFTLVNTGNGPGTFSFGPPTPALFLLPLASSSYVIAAGAALGLTAQFTPTSGALATATTAISSTGSLCGQSLAAIAFSGQGAIGQIAGYPTTAIDFGPVACGGGAPPSRSFVLTNTGTVVAHITQASISGAPGFTTSAAKGRYILPNGGVLAIVVSAPAVPSPAPLTPITATLTIQTDADPAPQSVNLVEEPSGAVLAFDTSATPSFGDFGSVVLLGSAAQTFGVANKGNAAANVSFVVTESPGAGGSDDAGTSPFAVANNTLSLPSGGSGTDSLVFTPASALPATASLALATTSPVCAVLPTPLPLSGSGMGGGPKVLPGQLRFSATCGGPAPAPQTFTVQNAGSANLTWSMSAVTGTGAAYYAVTANPPPGLLLPGAGALVTVVAGGIPSPAPSGDPQAYAAAVTITTDVPLDPPHVVSLGETPLGDQLSFSQASLRFGQVPLSASVTQGVTVANQANAGSPAAAFALAAQGGGQAGYTVTPSSATNVAGGGTSPLVNVLFTPSSAIAYPAALALTTTDPLCTPLPTPIPLSGTGTQGKVAVSTTSLTFGSDANDPLGLVDCGSTGQSHSFTVTNQGNQAFHLTGLTLAKGAASAFTVSGASVPAEVSIGGGVTLTVTPSPIPLDVTDPNDPSPFTDTLSITTDAALDAPHAVSLVMQARGAVIAATPLAQTWNFGDVGVASVGTITTTITNRGNAPASVTMRGLAQPPIFGLEGDPATVAPNATTALVGQFSPPASNGSWTDQGTLTIDGEAFCAPLPAAWNDPTIAFAGTSNSTPALTVAGSLVFPTTDCGAGSPAGQSVTLTNATNVAYPYSLQLQSGAFYAVTDAGPGTVPAHGAATFVVTPRAVLPGPGVEPGPAPYADDLLITVATSPAAGFVVPISWSLNGAVLSLPLGAGPSTDALGVSFYPADGTGSFSLPMQNAGTATAIVTFDVQPASILISSPPASGSISILPGLTASPGLTSAAGDTACPGTTSGTIAFFYSGPVCQPFPLASVNVRACAGALP